MDHSRPSVSRQVRVGVLAMQGAFREHIAALQRAGAEACEVRTPRELDAVDAIVLPGGESTTIRKLLVAADLYEPLRERLEGGEMPALGTCAGMVVLASTAPDGAPPCYGLLDVEVQRNGWGRQPHSFEAPVTLAGQGLSHAHDINGVFIRAPRIARTGPGVEVIGTLTTGKDAGETVAVRQGNLVACTFHPELVGDVTLHQLLVDMCAGGGDHGEANTEGLVGRA